MRTVWAFVVRDFHTQRSYRFALAQTILGVVFSAGLYFFLGGLISGAPELDVAGGSYFGFVVVGLALSAFLDSSIYQIASIFRSEQIVGTLEALITSPLGLSTILIGSSVFTYALAAVQALAYIAVGAVLGVDLSHANWGAGIVIAVLGVSCFAAVAGIVTAVGIITKRGNPLAFIVSSLSALVGGAYFPPSLLPPWLQWLTALHPLSYATRALREAILGGASLLVIAPDLFALLAFNAVLLPVSLYAFRTSVRMARMDGSLAHV